MHPDHIVVLGIGLACLVLLGIAAATAAIREGSDGRRDDR